MMLSSVAALSEDNGRGKDVLSLQVESPSWRVSVEESLPLSPDPPMTT